MSKYRVIQHGNKGRYEPQIKGWFFWSGFIDFNRPPIGGDLPIIFTKKFDTLKEALKVIKRHKAQMNQDTKIKVIISF